ncbi:MAG TPA: methyltransferase, TIGR04325 family [Opitutaceae bacterium]|nr:methyltransferase, TIGR04325 family [Opitutaceae bacterium]
MSKAQIIRRLTPPLVWDFSKKNMPGLVRALGGHYTHIRFHGDYATFDEARAASTGYDAPNILSKTREALLKIKRGENRWERDAMVSNTEEMHWALLAALTFIAAAKGNREISVLDFGGSLGSTYFWCKPFLAPEIRIRWSVVEQLEHVRVGTSDFQNSELKFFSEVDAALALEQPDVLLISGVLQFLPEPEIFLRAILEKGFPFLLLDRTPLWNHARHRLTVQEVPEEIYRASYPAWFLSRERILSIIEEKYRLHSRAADSENWEIDGEVVPNFLYFYRLK